MPCSNDQYPIGDKCCDRCPAGHHVEQNCTNDKKTKCAVCRHGSFTAGKNYLPECKKCKECIHNNNQEKVMACTAEKDTVCGCSLGFYCSSDDCGHCQRVRHCPRGWGVKVKATRTNDTICAPCEKGTYSNVTDFSSPCQAHTRCEDIGREFLTHGTDRTNAICGGPRNHCHWIIPTVLWSGFVLTVLVVLCLIYLKAKRKCFKAAVKSSPSVPAALLDGVSPASIEPQELPLKSLDVNDHCQESCAFNICQLPLFKSVDNEVCCSTQNSMDSSIPITPLKVSVSFVENKQFNGSPGHCTGILRTYSEPQEDEWCGT